jgi:hypothetical protein
MSFDAEFNAYSEYVYGFEDYFILKGVLGLKHYFWDIFRVFIVLWANQAGLGKNENRFRISVKN